MTTCVRVECFTHIDISLRGEAKEPFRVQVTSDLEGPNGQHMTIPGFYNGNGEWIIRFSPNTVGKWKYKTKSDISELDGVEGSIEAIQSKNPHNHGGLKIDPENPQNLLYEDGSRYFPIGYECNWLFALDLGGDSDLPKTRCLIDDISANGFNQVVMNVLRARVLI